MHRALGRPACAILLVLLIATDGAQAQQNPKTHADQLRQHRSHRLHVALFDRRAGRLFF